jgi:hypothetical protein
MRDQHGKDGTKCLIFAIYFRRHDSIGEEKCCVRQLETCLGITSVILSNTSTRKDHLIEDSPYKLRQRTVCANDRLLTVYMQREDTLKCAFLPSRERNEVLDLWRRLETQAETLRQGTSDSRPCATRTWMRRRH